MAAKIDIKKSLKELYSQKRAPHFVQVPPLRLLMIDGRGAPESPDFQGAVNALYSAMYTVKFTLKSEGRTDFVVPPLEVLWWAEDMTAFPENRRDEWQWSAMLPRMEHIRWDDVTGALAALSSKGKATPSHDLIRPAVLHEGRSVQALHVGPYESMGPTIEAVHEFAAANGFVVVGKQHDIYISDPRRAAPAKLKTIVRCPVAPA